MHNCFVKRDILPFSNSKSVCEESKKIKLCLMMCSIQLEGISTFFPWVGFGLRGINAFQTQKIGQEKLSKSTKMLNYIKSSCMIFTTKLL